MIKPLCNKMILNVMMFLYLFTIMFWTGDKKHSNSVVPTTTMYGPSWSWSCGSWIYNYLCIQCQSVRVRIPFMTLQYVIKFVSDLRLVDGFHRDTPVSSTNTTDRHDITEILLKMDLYTCISVALFTKSRKYSPNFFT